jgi:tRNA (cytidine/uridine-2'-O-)-methyltransferase
LLDARCCSTIAIPAILVAEQSATEAAGSGWHYMLRLTCTQAAMDATYEPQLHVVLYQPEIPYNTGSVGRTCVAVGAKLWLVRPLGFRVDDYYLRRAGLDYWEHLAWQVVDDWDAVNVELAGRRQWFFTKKAERSYFDAVFAPGDVLVFGNESSGLPDHVLAANPRANLRIPTRPAVRSLNLSNAVAVAAYEAQRQWAAGTSSLVHGGGDAVG